MNQFSVDNRHLAKIYNDEGSYNFVIEDNNFIQSEENQILNSFINQQFDIENNIKQNNINQQRQQQIQEQQIQIQEQLQQLLQQQYTYWNSDFIDVPYNPNFSKRYDVDEDFAGTIGEKFEDLKYLITKSFNTQRNLNDLRDIELYLGELWDEMKVSTKMNQIVKIYRSLVDIKNKLPIRNLFVNEYNRAIDLIDEMLRIIKNKASSMGFK